MNQGRALAACLLACVLIGVSDIARAVQILALLIGVSSYPSFDAGLRLEGPVNDVTLMRRVLLERGVPEERIRILADGVAGAPAATRRAILDALAELARDAGHDDVVYLHFSGHGSQQPNAEGATREEPDALDEIFLPYDTGIWDDDTATVHNALVDDELRQAIDAVRARGAFVWAVFDSCHAGTLTRAIPMPSERERRVEASRLGVPETGRGGRTPIGGPLESSADRNQPPGGLVAFFAAQTFETAPELPLPPGTPDQKTYGLLSYTLAETLLRHEALSYRQTADQILRAYAAAGRDTPTPLFVGTDLDAPVLGEALRGGTAVQSVRRSSDGLLIGLGRLHGIREGDVFAILSDPAGGPDTVLGQAEVGDLGLLAATLSWPRDAPQTGDSELYARIERRSVAPRLTVAHPPPAADPESRRALALLDDLKREGSGPDLRWVSAAEDADVRLFVDAGRLWLLPPSARLGSAGQQARMSIPLAEPDAVLTERLGNMLTRVAKVTALLRLAQQVGGGRVRIEIAAEAHQAGAGSRYSLRAAAPRLTDGDNVQFRVRNPGPRPVDLTALFIDSAYGITPWVPDPGEVNRIEAGGAFAFELEVAATDPSGAPSTLGKERMLVLAVEAEPGKPLADFSFLAQPRLTTWRAASSGVARVLSAATFGGPLLRGDIIKPRQSVLERVDMQVFGWEVVAPVER